MKRYFSNSFSYSLNIFLILVILAYLVYLYINHAQKNKYSVEGKYTRVYGDNHQPKYLDSIKNGGSYNYIYYDDNKNIIDNGIEESSLFKKESSVTHTNSLSICKKMYSFNDYSIGKCIGYATKKFNKHNVKYQSFHNYYSIDNDIYYENTYFFDDGDISFAIYKRT